MTAEEMRQSATQIEVEDATDWHVSQQWLQTAEICERLDLLNARLLKVLEGTDSIVARLFRQPLDEPEETGR